MKQLPESPWDSGDEKYGHGTIINGKVTRVMDFGAFVELEPGVEGLIHISELSPARVRRVIAVVKPGQDVQLMLLSIDKGQRRLSLPPKRPLPHTPAPPPPATAENAAPLEPPPP